MSIIRSRVHRALALLGPLSVFTLAACGSPPDSLESSEAAVGHARPSLEGAPPIVLASTVKVQYELPPISGGGCSGTLVRPNRVLTAKHCVAGMNPKGFQVYFEPSLSFNPRHTRGVSFSRVHPTADVATLDLDDDAPTDNGYSVALIHEPVQGGLQAGNRVALAGFGTTDNAKGFGQLRWGKMVFARWLPEYSLTGVGKFSSGLQFFPDASEGTDMADAYSCAGDSGGPVYQWTAGAGWRVTGVISGGDCTADGIVLAADARGVKAWILAN